MAKTQKYSYALLTWEEKGTLQLLITIFEQQYISLTTPHSKNGAVDTNMEVTKNS